jgi:catechol 2,3-dioxygenase-like lactoylglutathione lyase family enzyme
MAVVRYIVKDVGKSIEFYTERLDFKLSERFGDAFAIVKRGDLPLWMAGPQASASRPMPDGRQPEPGGWNRFVIEVEDLAGLVAKLRASGAKFRNEILTGPGGQQILLEDPSHNLIELFQAG